MAIGVSRKRLRKRSGKPVIDMNPRRLSEVGSVGVKTMVARAMR